jgi:cardiolipin synthase
MVQKQQDGGLCLWVFARLFVIMGCLLVFAGCKSPVKMEPVAAPDATKKVRLQSAQGTLSVQQSADILAKLRARGGSSAALAQHIAAEDAVARSPLFTGNKVTLLEDGPATYKAMVAAITAARRHINLETYIIEDDEIGRRFAELLLKKCAAGVEVNLMYDSVGNIGTPAEFFDRLRRGGVRVLEFNPVNPLTAKKGWAVNRRDHRKLLVVDGRKAFIGGINISSVYSSGSSPNSRPRADGKMPWRDTHIQIDGPVVADFQRLFMDTWQQQKGKPLMRKDYVPALTEQGDEIVRALGSSADDAGSPIYTALLSAINSAVVSVHITNAYFVPNPEFLDALKAAAGRGVDVKLILPSHTDFWAVFHAGRSHYSDLLQAGVKIHERKGALLHAKTALIDDVWSCIGSANLDWRSFVHNNELNAVVLGNDFSRQMRAAFTRDLAESEEILLEQWERRPLNVRLREAAARVWEYWL